MIDLRAYELWLESQTPTQHTHSVDRNVDEMRLQASSSERNLKPKPTKYNTPQLRLWQDRISLVWKEHLGSHWANAAARVDWERSPSMTAQQRDFLSCINTVAYLTGANKIEFATPWQGKVPNPHYQVGRTLDAYFLMVDNTIIKQSRNTPQTLANLEPYEEIGFNPKGAIHRDVFESQLDALLG